MKSSTFSIALVILAFILIVIGNTHKVENNTDYISETSSTNATSQDTVTQFNTTIDDAISGLTKVISTLHSTTEVEIETTTAETTTKPTTTTKPETTIRSEIISEAIKKVERERPNDPNKYFLTDLGKFRISFYNPGSDNGAWGYATATGVRSEHLATCAVDPNVIPLGSVIVVNGLTLKCVDVGGAVKGKTIDIFFDGSEKEMLAYGNEFGDYANVKLQYLGGGN